MSFLSVLKKIGHVIAVGEGFVAPFAPLIEAIPGAGTIFGTVFQGILIAEQLLSTANTGPQKKILATAVVNAVHPGLDQAALGSAIDGLVAALNHIGTSAAVPVLAVPVKTP